MFFKAFAKHGHFAKLCVDHPPNISRGCHSRMSRPCEKRCPVPTTLRDFVMTSTTDKIKGAANEAAGSIKKGAGEAVGNPKVEAEGAAQKLKEKSSRRNGRRQGRGQGRGQKDRRRVSNANPGPFFHRAGPGAVGEQRERAIWKFHRSGLAARTRRIHGGSSHERHHLSRWSYRGHHGHSFLPWFALSGKKGDAPMTDTSPLRRARQTNQRAALMSSGRRFSRERSSLRRSSC